MTRTTNVGVADRLIRTFLIAPGAIAGAVALGATTGPAIALYVVAGVMLATAASGFCPLFALVGVSTVPRRHRGAAHPGYPERTERLTPAA